MNALFRYSLFALLLAATAAVGQTSDPLLDPAEIASAPLPKATSSDISGIPKGLQSTIEALGASSGVPDGVGLTRYSAVPVRGQNARMGFSNYQFGVAAPLYASDSEGLFATTSIRTLDVQSNAMLPTDHLRFPTSFWDVQFGGGYVRQLASGWSGGAIVNLGSASDRPFHSLAEGTLTAMAFVRKPQGDRNGWLFYAVSSTNGQLGRNLPVPGVAYEFYTEKLHGVVGLPFVTLDYKPTQSLQFELYYAAVTDLQTRASYHPTQATRVYLGFEWANHSWFRANRPSRHDQLFLYEKRIEGGFGWAVHDRVDFRLSGGYAFDRFFVENTGLSLRGRNRLELSPTPFVAAQIELKY